MLHQLCSSRMFRALRNSGAVLYTAQTRFAHAAAAGFAGIKGLQESNHWFSLAQEALQRCEELVNRAVSEPPSAQTVQTLDDISDVLCQVLDAAEFCRNAHADQEWRSAAQQVCLDLGGYVQHLNTHYGLYTALSHALNQQHAQSAAAAAAQVGGSQRGDPRSSGGGAVAGGGGSLLHGAARMGSGWTEETLLVGRMLKRDFEKYGVHLEGEARDRMNALVQRTQQLGMGITQNIVTPSQVGTLELRGQADVTRLVPRHHQKLFRPLADKRSGQVLGLTAPADSSLLNSIMLSSPEEAVRKQAYLAYTQQPSENVRLLDQLVEGRHEVAAIMGSSSYAHYQLDGVTLANCPEAVQAFMAHLHTSIAPKCEQELGMLRQAKEQEGGHPAELFPWDRSHLMSLVKARHSSRASPGGDASLTRLPQYFQLETVMEGLSGLLMQLTGVRLEKRALERGEGWAPGVRKLEAVHPEEGLLGTVYLDLYQRPSGKFPGAAHFTLRCGRRLADGTYQTPVVALVANLAPLADLSHSEVETLFHEFGHAIHSLFSRTHYQHLAGTRGPLDTVEIASHTLEHFSMDPRVLSTFARHKTSGNPLPPELLAALWDSRRLFAGLDLQSQLVYCAVDQVLHGPDPPTGQRAQQALGEVVQQYSSFGYCPGTWPHLRFNHLVGYGATYYSYLYAQCLSADIWQHHFAADPLSRASGEALRHNLLEAGGSREAHAVVEGLVGSAHMHGAQQGWYPDTSSMLRQLGVA